MNEHLDHALDAVAHDRSPASEMAYLDEEEQRMVRMAQLLRGSRGQEVPAPLVEELRGRLFPSSRRVSRRTAFLSGIGTLAAGILAGVGLDHAINEKGSTPEQALVGHNGKWYQVAQLADLPDGSIRPFTAGAVQGFLIHRKGNVRAMSRICTHMGCALKFERNEQAFVCPCHGAEFDLQGHSRYGPGGYGSALPPLPGIKTRVNGGTVEVWSV